MVPTAAPSWVQAGPEATPCTGEETWLTQHPQPGTGPGASAASQASPFHLHCRHLSWLRPLPAGQAGPEDSREEQGSPVDAHERALNPVPASRAHILHPHPNLLLHPETHWVPEDAACYLQTPTFAQGHLPAAALACARIPGNQVLPSGPAPACPAPPPPAWNTASLSGQHRCAAQGQAHRGHLWWSRPHPPPASALCRTAGSGPLALPEEGVLGLKVPRCRGVQSGVLATQCSLRPSEAALPTSEQ